MQNEMLEQATHFFIMVFVSVVFKYICFVRKLIVFRILFGGVLRSLKFWSLQHGLTSTMFLI
jgi:hypothetical protein